MAQVAKEWLDQMQDPELSIEQAMTDYRRLGYSENWINQRIKSMEIRKELTDEWKRCGLEEGVQFATLTDIIYKTWSDHVANPLARHPKFYCKYLNYKAYNVFCYKCPKKWAIPPEENEESLLTYIGFTISIRNPSAFMIL